MAKLDPAEWLIHEKNPWLKQNWRQISDYTAAVMHGYHELPASELSPLMALDPHRDILGTGFWGIAYKLTERVTLKLTLDQAEAAMWRAVWLTPTLRNHPGVAYILNEGFVPHADVAIGANVSNMAPGAYKVFAIIREAILPFPKDRKRLKGRERAHAADLLEQTRETAEDAVDDLVDRAYEGNALKDYREAISALEEGPHAVRAVGAFMRVALAVSSVQAVLADTHPGNVGWPVVDMSKQGPAPVDYTALKVFDLGVSQLPPSAAAKYLQMVGPNPSEPCRTSGMAAPGHALRRTVLRSARAARPSSR
jgi:hypothetical protein